MGSQIQFPLTGSMALDGTIIGLVSAVSIFGIIKSGGKVPWAILLVMIAWGAMLGKIKFIDPPPPVIDADRWDDFHNGL